MRRRGWREQTPGSTGANSPSKGEQLHNIHAAGPSRCRQAARSGWIHTARTAAPHRVLMVPSRHVLRSRGHAGDSRAVGACHCGGAFRSNAGARHAHRVAGLSGAFLTCNICRAAARGRAAQAVGYAAGALLRATLQLADGEIRCLDMRRISDYLSRAGLIAVSVVGWVTNAFIGRAAPSWHAHFVV